MELSRFFVDIDPDSYNICPEQFEKVIASLSRKDMVKAIIPVHLYGQCADMGPLLKVANDNHMIIIEDAAQAIGAEYDNCMAGSFGNCACFSLFPSKVLGAYGDGGVITTISKRFNKLLRIMRNHGATKRYHHRIVGGNFRLDVLQAAIVSVKMKYLDGWMRARNINADRYKELFKEAELSNWVNLPSNCSGFHTYSYFVINVIERRNELKADLLDHGISSEVYCPIPLHLQKCFSYLKYDIGAFPVSEYAAKQTLSIPVYPELTFTQQTFIVDVIRKFFM